jgi:acetolactate synthase-1/2/3 large subunit
MERPQAVVEVAAGRAEYVVESAVESADLIVAYLETLGIEYVFGIPGGAIEPLYDALARSERRGGPRAIQSRHEAGAAFMADGYARETGKIGVCMATSGPGATNLITGVACAYDNGVPMLVLTGQPALPSFGKRPFQESACTGINTVGMFRHCTRYNSLVSHPDQLQNKLVNAVMRAHQAHGPAHLTIPVDILRSPAVEESPSYDLPSLLQRASLVDEMAVRELCTALNAARRIVFILGGGCEEAVSAIMDVVDTTSALFLTTPDGKGLVNPRHPAYRGVFGFAGHQSADALLKGEPDLIIAVGTHLGEWNSGGWCESILNDRLVHIDSSEEHLMRTPMARMHVRGRIRSVFARLGGMLSEPRHPVALREVHTEPAEPWRMVNAPDKAKSDNHPIKPQRLMAELARRFPADTRFLADTGNSTAWAVHYLEPGRAAAPVTLGGPLREVPDNWLRVTMDFAPMGWAIGAAIGVARADPSRPVVCITGDGSYLMNGQEITVAAEEGLCVVFVVLNDSSLGMVKHGQRLSGAERTGFKLPAVDFRLMAEATGVPGHVIRSPHDFETLDFDTIFNRNGPTLLDVRIDGEEVPPMSVRMKVLGAK